MWRIVYPSIPDNNTEDIPGRPGIGLQGMFYVAFTSDLYGNFLGIGFSVVQIRLIFYPIGHIDRLGTPNYLTYAQRFDIVPQPTSTGLRASVPDPVTGLYVLKRATRSNKSRMGDIVPLYNYQKPVELLPRHGTVADSRLTAHTSMEFGCEFSLNKYFDKETFYYFLQSNS